MTHYLYLLKQAWASLMAKKGILVTIVTTLGLTLGALLCILTLAYVVIYKPLPYPDQEHLFRVNANIVDSTGEQVYRGVFSYPSLIHFYENQSQFLNYALVRYEERILSSQPTQPVVASTFVTPDWFTLLGSKMALGRGFEKTESKDSFNPVAILTYDTWQKEFSADPGILEQTVTINDASYRVVGVLAKSFIEPQLFGIGVKTDIYLPWEYNQFNLDPSLNESFGNWSYKHSFVGKLDQRQGLSVRQIEQTLTTMSNTYWRENVSQKSEDLKIELESFKRAIVGDSQNTVLLLLAGVIGLILIACTNITNLFMSHTASQQRELAIHAALGASKRHIFQTFFAQSGLVVFMSVIVALIVAHAGFSLLQQFLALQFPRVAELKINSVTLGAALAVALLLGLFFANISARMVNYRALNATLQSSGKGTGIQVSRNVRRGLIISQVTVVTLLVFVNISLLTDSLKVINKPLGLDTENTQFLKVKISGEMSDQDMKTSSQDLKKKLMALPQVEDVSHAPSPLGYHGSRPLTIQATGERLHVKSKYIDDRYFHITGQTLVEGDYFSPADFSDRNPLIIINDVYASKVASQGNALGTKLTIFSDVLTVSGVVKSSQMPTETDVPMRAYMINSWSWDSFVIKLKPQQNLSRELAATTVKEASPQFMVHQLQTLNEQRDRLLFTQYITAFTSSVLAVLTFFLAAIGLYGILSYATQMRRFELGTRLAIGAKRNDLITLIVKDNADAVAIGFLISLVLIAGLYLSLSELLIHYVGPHLISVFLGTLGLIGVMALFACYWPLRPIINVPPLYSLRGE